MEIEVMWFITGIAFMLSLCLWFFVYTQKKRDIRIKKELDEINRVL